MGRDIGGKPPKNRHFWPLRIFDHFTNISGQGYKFENCSVVLFLFTLTPGWCLMWPISLSLGWGQWFFPLINRVCLYSTFTYMMLPLVTPAPFFRHHRALSLRLLVLVLDWSWNKIKASAPWLCVSARLRARIAHPVSTLHLCAVKCEEKSGWIIFKSQSPT